MLKYKINIADALERKGFNTYKAKTTKILSQDTLKKIKNEDTNISLESINRICIILDMQPKDLIEYVEDKNEKNKYNFWKIFKNITWQSNIMMIKYNQTKGKDARRRKVKNMAQNRITIPKWQGIKAGQEVETGFPGIVLTAPSEPGEYTLYECAEGNTHAGWVFKKTK